ncbi:MAG: nucleotide sugar dehydrogenase [Candidatus Methylomirabilales bacterium]
MQISIFGLGYVGAVTAACLAEEGHQVIGADVNATKVAMLNAGRSPIVETGLVDLIGRGVGSGRIRATRDVAEAIQGTDLSLVCVGTPSRRNNGALDLTFVERVCEAIGLEMGRKARHHLVVIRSTVLPGTTETTLTPILEKASGKACGPDFGVAYNPEFMRESCAVHDFYHPPRTVIGARGERDADLVAGLYRGIQAPLVTTSIRAAEMVKYTDNAFHALKVTFANEIGVLCKALGIDSHEVMDIFCLDTKLNLSPYYLRPGFAFGGSCLPKDLRALAYKAKTLDLTLPVLNAVQASNELHIKTAVDCVMATERKRIGVLGLAFKAGTDDVRESPVVALIEALLGKGCCLKVFDPSVAMTKLSGANREFLEGKIPHIAELLVGDGQEIADHAEVVVVGNRSREFVDVLSRLRPEQHVIDLVRIAKEARTSATYEGIAW